MPAQFTTTSARTSPCSVATPLTRPRAARIAVTLMFSAMRTPALRAPRASARVVSTGFVWPSFGRNTAPMRPSVASSGQRSWAAPGDRICTSRPKQRAMDAPRFSSSKRASLAATAMEPTCLKPVAWPVSRSSPS